MKPLAVAGWVLWALEAVFVVVLFIQRNVGDDAAGRGMATGFAIVLAPIVLAAGALMLWGRRGGPAAAYWIGLFVVSIPVLFGAWRFATGKVASFGRAAYRAQFGRFADARLTDLAKAIDRADLDRMKALLAEGPVDYAERDPVGRTILGHAIFRVTGDYTNRGSVEPVRLLLDAGAPAREDVMAPESTPANPDGNHLLIQLVGGRDTTLLELLLSRGLSPDGVDSDGSPVLFSTYLSSPVLEVLLRHGVNVDVLDPRSDRAGWTTAMVRALFEEWDQAAVLIRHGVSVDHAAADGATLMSILAEKREQSGSSSGLDSLAVLVAERRGGRLT
ncbi:MAG: hypothetical protein R2882_01310 [Gemmatimonadales bacterium]